MKTATLISRLQQLRDLLAAVIDDPDDSQVRRQAGRMAGMACLILLDESDDRRRLMLDLLADGLGDAPPSSHTTKEPNE